MEYQGLFILPHQGLGDHILCAGIYREYAKRFPHVVLPVKATYYRSVKKMLRDSVNIQVLSYPRETLMKLHQDFLSHFGYEKLKLGGYGFGFFSDPTLRLDETFYHQAGIPLSSRWDSFYYERDAQKENELHRLLGCLEQEYIFVHDDSTRGFKLRESSLPKNIRVVKPIPELASKYTIFDYLKVIENAKEIHCMESSFVAMIESFQIDVPKFAHRYARPEAKSNVVFEFTYKSPWTVLN